jgi:two-component system chemotaxis response regulator CheB
MTPIKVLLVEDSPVAIGLYKKLLESSSEIQVVGTALDGNQALTMIPSLQPQVVVTDLQMPGMDGYELIKQAMARYPVPILVLSNAVQKEDIDNYFKVLQLGALDVMPKPQGGTANEEELKKTLITKVKVLATKKVSAKPIT